MTDKKKIIDGWIATARVNIAKFQRSPLHEQLRTDTRDRWTQLYEFHTEIALKALENRFWEAHWQEQRPERMSATQSPEGCLELGTAKSPNRTTIGSINDYTYRLVAYTQVGVLPDGLREQVRHRCHNRKCICPDHLQIGYPEQNRKDDKERNYAGRDARGG